METTHETTDYWSDVASLADDIYDDFSRWNDNHKEILHDFLLQLAIDPVTKGIYGHYSKEMLADALSFVAMRVQELQLDSNNYL